MLTQGAIGNLINRYRAVLEKCRIMNTFGALAAASMLVLGSTGLAEAVDIATPMTIIKGSAPLEDVVLVPGSTDSAGQSFIIVKNNQITLNGGLDGLELGIHSALGKLALLAGSHDGAANYETCDEPSAEKAGADGTGGRKMSFVHLHVHTEYSLLDGSNKIKNYVNRVKELGMNAAAITDHGVVQGFTDANHFMHTLDKSDPFKIIYGVEGYIVDDLQDVAVNEKGQELDGTFVVFDLETTGFSPIKDKIIEIGAVKVVNGQITEKFSTFVNPKVPIPFEITQLTSITDQMVLDAPTIEKALPDFLEFVGDAVLVAHNASFDVSFIEQNCRYQDITTEFTSVDTVAMARILLPTLSKYKLIMVDLKYLSFWYSVSFLYLYAI